MVLHIKILKNNNNHHTTPWLKSKDNGKYAKQYYTSLN